MSAVGGEPRPRSGWRSMKLPNGSGGLRWHKNCLAAGVFPLPAGAETIVTFPAAAY